VSCLQPQREADLIECTSPLRGRVAEVGVINVHPDHNRLQRRNTPNDLSLARALAAMRRLFMDSDSASVPDSTYRTPGGKRFLQGRPAPSSRRGECPVVTRGPDAPRCEAHKVFQFSQAGHCPPRLARSNRDMPHGRSLAVRSDVMIRRSSLVAGPAGSEWLTRTFIA
jgi:hypothetical protein